jgi:iron complex transport system substrate-binding protein
MIGTPRPAGTALLRIAALAGTMMFGGHALAVDAPLKDAAGQPVVARDASRVVSIGGAITEILYALGKDATVVGVDTTSQYPPRALKEKPNVGYMRQLSPEGVLGLAPSLILASEGSGPKETLSVLEAARVPIVVVPDHFTAEGILDKIRIVSRSVGADRRGECIANVLRAEFATLDRLKARIEKPVRVMFILSFVNSRAMVAGRHTAADGVIRLAGAVNAIDDYEGYKPVNDEAITAARPDVILAMTRSHADPLSAKEVFANPALSTTPAAKDNAFVLMDALYLLGFGPRTALAARDLFGKLYPSLKNEPFPSEQAAGSIESCGK